MSRKIDYFFSCSSTWTFIGHRAFMDMVKAHGAEVAFWPMPLGPIFAETGGLPLPKRAPARQRHRLLEMQRWRVKRQLDFHLHPAFWPFDPALADRMVIAAIQQGLPVGDLVERIVTGVWERQENMADPALLAAAADAVGLPGETLLAAAGSEASIATYEANREKALAAGVFGAPSFVLDGEVFWGQDRIDLLADALESGRAPFSPEV